MGHTFNRPDEAAMLRILERHPHSPEGAILRLAWLEGLSRSEITELRWDQVDFEGKAIQLPDRTVPLEPSTETCLRERHVRCALRDPHVVISERSKKPMPPESISRLSRLALDSEGQKVNLMDLRHDFVIRQLQTHDWPYVARVSGMAVSTLRDAFSPYLTKPAAPENPLAQRDEAEYLLWRVIQQEGSSPAGLALWMGWKLQMQPGEIASLTWGQVDFDQNLIRLPDRTVSMGSRLRRMLSETLTRRKDPAEERVFTSPATGRPMERAQLTAAARTALLRGGLEGVSLRDLCAEGRRADQSRMLAEQAAAHGWLECGDVMRLLGVSRTAARQQLLRLREAGVLVRVGERYYPAGAVTPPEEQLAVIQTYLLEHGSGRRQDFLRLLNVSPAQGTQILRRLTARGALILTGRRYTLPDGK